MRDFLIILCMTVGAWLAISGLVELFVLHRRRRRDTFSDKAMARIESEERDRLLAAGIIWDIDDGEQTRVIYRIMIDPSQPDDN